MVNAITMVGKCDVDGTYPETAKELYEFTRDNPGDFKAVLLYDLENLKYYIDLLRDDIVNFDQHEYVVGSPLQAVDFSISDAMKEIKKASSRLKK